VVVATARLSYCRCTSPLPKRIGAFFASGRGSVLASRPL
jgi:hypothetical protein